MLGGPKDLLEERLVFVSNALLWLISVLFSTVDLGSPRPQLGGAVGTFRGTGTNTWISPRFR
jgi:hypothetical protein